MHCKIMATRIKTVLPTSPLKLSQANSPLGFLNVFQFLFGCFFTHLQSNPCTSPFSEEGFFFVFKPLN